MKQLLLILTVLLLVALVWTQFDPRNAQSAASRTISVEGSGEIEVIPDIIRLHYNVAETHDSDVGVAKAEVDRRSAASVRALTRLGVSEDDITSSSLDVEIVENFHNRGETPPTQRHRVRRNVEVVLRDVTLYNKVLQALVDSRISEITQVRPDVSNEDELKREALASAAADARAQAEFLAEQFDTALGGVHQIGRQNIQRHFDLQEVVVTASRRAPAQTDVPYDFKPGTVKVTSNVYVEFELE